MKQFATITVIGKDKTGVIARVTNYLFHAKANIEALEEQVNSGQFSMSLQASWATAGFDPGKLRKGFEQLAGELGMEIRVRFADPKRKQRLAILVTKETHCFEAILAAVRKGSLKAEPCVVIGNHDTLEALAAKHKLPFHHVPYGADRAAAERKMLALADEYDADFIALARFMKILSPQFVWRWKNKIINIHPSLLPSFPGASPYWQAFEKGVRIAGVTAHFVTTNLDEGPIIWQESFTVSPDDTLKCIRQKGQKLESKTLVKALQLYVNKRLDVHWGKVYRF
ncbi:formyltetrahydrofolate deformylase [Kamptonema cortianum]|nr:formyltetrahydrofolate deformylase [Oscillatoria laete-virens]MDK3159599.1 formyltetrahydrofolate deformylase [Kamptonema cortianum]MDL5048645.1 formyltetrahydrofolate deformylase [Oscillatoria amoena NRMC-F 0135]MDL5053263.1 formyltetrahydrofolate deformylase [Oscillatoria laete-virens NRMC-F 0139]